jgi:uncharacterized protein YunC (DUF1805 family)
METQGIQLSEQKAVGYQVSLGPVNLVMALADAGLVGCGALDIKGMEKLGIAAARVSGVATVDDLLAAEINFVNELAQRKGVHIGMTGRQALEKLQA